MVCHDHKKRKRNKGTYTWHTVWECAKRPDDDTNRCAQSAGFHPHRQYTACQLTTSFLSFLNFPGSENKFLNNISFSFMRSRIRRKCKKKWKKKWWVTQKNSCGRQVIDVVWAAAFFVSVDSLRVAHSHGVAIPWWLKVSPSDPHYVRGRVNQRCEWHTN